MRPPSTARFHKVRRLAAEPHLVIHEMLGEYGDFMCWRGFYDLYLVNHPEFIRPVLSQSYERFSKRTIDYRVLARVMGNGLVTSDDLPRIPYLKQVVQESMRIYPPVWAYARRSEQEEEFDGCVLPANGYVAVVPYALHRHPEFWPDAERFDPDRFQPNRGEGRDSYS